MAPEMRKRMVINVLTVGMIQTNCYVVHQEDSDQCVVIDPGDEAQKIADYLRRKELSCKGILLTHGHFDHITGVAELVAMTGAKTYAYEEEKDLMADPGMNGSANFSFGKEVAIEPEVLLRDKQILEIAGLRFQIIHTPGHTKGGCCFYSEEDKALFCGDTLFMESIGRTDFPTGNGRQLVDSVRNKLFVLPGDVTAYPGHGPETTIDYEQANNMFV